MFQESLSDYVFQAGVLLQPLLWMWLHGSRLKFPESLKYGFYSAAMVAVFAVWVTGFSVGFYTTFLIIQYCVFTALAVYLLNTRYCFKEALCLGFLLVFLNSYYWELPLHIAAVLSGEPVVNVVFQLWRLAPLPFLLSRYSFAPKARYVVEAGIGVSGVIMLAWWFLHLRRIWWILPLNRVVCLLLLVKVVAEAEPKQRGIP